jgi:hypothetical protein
LLLALVVGCGEILNLPSDPVLSDRYRCADDESRSETMRESAHVRVQACNFVSTNCAEPVRGVSASLCNKKDVDCAKPLRSGLRDQNGELAFDVQTGGPLGAGFDGYLRVVTESARCDDEATFGSAAAGLCSLLEGCDEKREGAACMLPTFAPALLFFNPPLTADLARPAPLPLIPTAAVPSLTMAANGKFDATRGNVFVTVLDCAGAPMAGVRLALTSAGAGSSVLYVQDGVISANARRTDASGIGGVLNVPAGFASVAGFVDDGDGGELQLAEIGLQVARFTITYTTLVPPR